MNRQILGLDISDDAVSAVLMEKNAQDSRIEAYAYEPFSDTDEDGLMKALETVMQKINIADADCKASFTPHRLSFRNIQVPFKEKKKIRQVLPFEIEPTVPFPLDEFEIDFNQINIRAAGTENQPQGSDLVVAAVEREYLASYLEDLASTGLDPEIVTISGYAAALQLAGMTRAPDRFIFVDIGCRKSAVFIVVSGEIVLIRSVTDDVSRPEGMRQLAIDIQQTLSGFEDLYEIELTPEKIFVNSCSDDGASIDAEIEKTTGYPVARIDLRQDADIAIESKRDMSWVSGRMNKAFALANLKLPRTRFINFRKDQFAFRKQWLEHRKDFIRTGILAGVVLLFVLINLFFNLYSVKREISRLEHQKAKVFTETFPDVKITIANFPYMREMERRVAEAREAYLITGEGGTHHRAIDILHDISSAVPENADIKFTRLVAGPESVLISGDTDTFNAVDDVKNRFEKISRFKKITISSTSKDKSGERIRFKLNIQL